MTAKLTYLFPAPYTYSQNTLFVTIIDAVKGYSAFKGLFVVILISLGLLTMDSYINAASTIFAHDAAHCFGFFKEKNKLWTARVSSVAIGFGVLLMALSLPGLWELVFAIHAAFYMPVVTVPLLLAIFGFRSDSRSVLYGMLAAALLVVPRQIGMLTGLIQNKALVIVIGMMANAVVFIHVTLCAQRSHMLCWSQQR